MTPTHASPAATTPTGAPALQHRAAVVATRTSTLAAAAAGAASRAAAASAADSSLRAVSQLANRIRSCDFESNMAVDGLLSQCASVNLSRFADEVATVVLDVPTKSSTRCFFKAYFVAALDASRSAVSYGAVARGATPTNASGTATTGVSANAAADIAAGLGIDSNLQQQQQQQQQQHTTPAFVFSDRLFSSNLNAAATLAVSAVPETTPTKLDLEQISEKDDALAAKVPDFFVNIARPWNSFIRQTIQSTYVVLDLVLLGAIESPSFFRSFFAKLSTFLLSAKAISILRSLVELPVDERLSVLRKRIIDHIDMKYAVDNDTEYDDADLAHLTTGYCDVHSAKSQIVHALLSRHASELGLAFADALASETENYDQPFDFVDASLVNVLRQTLCVFYLDFIDDVARVYAQLSKVAALRNRMLYSTGTVLPGIDDLHRILEKQAEIDRKIINTLSNIFDLPRPNIKDAPYGAVPSITYSSVVKQLDILCFSSQTNINNFTPEQKEKLASLTGEEPIAELQSAGLLDDYDRGYYIAVFDIRAACPPLKNKTPNNIPGMQTLSLEPEEQLSSETTKIIDTSEGQESAGLPENFPRISELVNKASKAKSAEDIDSITALLAYRVHFSRTEEQLIQQTLYGSASFSLLRLYARMYASLAPYYPNCVLHLTQELVKRISFAIYKPSPNINFEAPAAKYIYLLSEMAKFRIVPIHFIVHFLRRLCSKLNGSNIFLLQTLCRSIGAFLLTAKETQEAFSIAIRHTYRTLDRKVVTDTKSKALKISRMKEFAIAVSACIPDDWNMSAEDFIRELRDFKIKSLNVRRHEFATASIDNSTLRSGLTDSLPPFELQQKFADFFTVSLDNIDSAYNELFYVFEDPCWRESASVATAVELFSAVWLYKDTALPRIAYILYRSKAQIPHILTRVVDTLFELLNLSLFRNNEIGTQHSIAIAEMIAHLYVFGIIPQDVIIDTLYLILSTGHKDGIPLPYAVVEGDPTSSSYRIRMFIALFQASFHYRYKSEFIDSIRTQHPDMPQTIDLSTPLINLKGEDAMFLVRCRTLLQFLNLYFLTRVAPGIDITMLTQSLVTSLNVEWFTSYEKVAKAHFPAEKAEKVIEAAQLLKVAFVKAGEEQQQLIQEEQEAKKERFLTRKNLTDIMFIEDQYRDLVLADTLSPVASSTATPRLLKKISSSVGMCGLVLPSVPSPFQEDSSLPEGVFGFLKRNSKNKDEVIMVSGTFVAGSTENEDDDTDDIEQAQLRSYILNNYA